MGNMNAKGTLYLFNGFKFTGKIEDGSFKEGIMESYSIKFKGIWGNHYISLPSNTDEPDYEEVECLEGEIYKLGYKYVGKFVPEEFYKEKIVSYEEVKVYNKDTGKFVKECFIDESDKNDGYFSSYNNNYEYHSSSDTSWEHYDESYDIHHNY